jgi:hypothetical protein
MTKMIERGKLIWLLAVASGVAVLSHVLVLSSKGSVSLGLTSLWALATSGVTTAGITYYAFERWLWKCRWLQGWLVNFPNIGGTWEAVSYSETFDGPHIAVVTILHEFEDISYTSRTAHSTNSAIGAVLIKSPNRQIMLITVYHNDITGKLAEHTAPHDGCCRLVLEKPQDEKSPTANWVFRGEYWTNKVRNPSEKNTNQDRGTVGSMALTWKSSKIVI